MNLDIYEDAERLAKRYGTRDPFELLDAMNVVVKFTDKFPKGHGKAPLKDLFLFLQFAI